MKNSLKTLKLFNFYDILFWFVVIWITATTLYQNNIYSYSLKQLICRIPNSAIFNFKHLPAMRAYEAPNAYRVIYLNIIK